MLNIILQNLKVRFGMKLMKVRILYIIHFFYRFMAAEINILWT